MESYELYQKVGHSLAGCQMVEQELKLYISEALKLTKKCINKRMPFRFNEEDHLDFPLGRLIQEFKRYTEHDALVQELNNFRKDRDYLTHKAIANCLDCEGELLDSMIAELEPKLVSMQKESERLVQAIHGEFTKISVQVDFWDV
jgi:hypothetical protein